jgi:hypothetical protein
MTRAEELALISKVNGLVESRGHTLIIIILLILLFRGC